jgi:hypothetical protein
LQETVAVPDPATLAGLIAAQVSPDGMASVRDTVPGKWFSAVIEMVDVVDTPTFEPVGEVAAIAKSRNWNRAVADWTREPLVPVTVRV